jgi:hypothetical protein
MTRLVGISHKMAKPEESKSTFRTRTIVIVELTLTQYDRLRDVE